MCDKFFSAPALNNQRWKSMKDWSKIIVIRNISKIYGSISCIPLSSHPLFSLFRCSLSLHTNIIRNYDRFIAQDELPLPPRRQREKATARKPEVFTRFCVCLRGYSMLSWFYLVLLIVNSFMYFAGSLTLFYNFVTFHLVEILFDDSLAIAYLFFCIPLLLICLEL